MRLRRPRAPLAILLCCFFVVGACRRGPDAEALEAEVKRRLDEHFEDGLFQIEWLRRRGSSPFPAQGERSGGVFVYYDARFRFERDYSLTAWRGLNLGTLAYVLGATESGVTGFSARGNQAGDPLEVHGRLAFHRGEDADGWTPAETTRAPVPEASSPPAKVRGSGPDALLAELGSLLGRTAQAPRGSRDALIAAEIRRARARIDLGLARLDGSVTFGAGPAGGAYHAFGGALAQFTGKRTRPIYSYESEGSRENGRLLRDQSLDFGLLQSDVAELLYQGSSLDGFFPHRDLRSVASLWPEAVHLVTLDATGIRRFADLAGRRVGVGSAGSGTRFNAIRIGVAAGFEEEDVLDVREVGTAEGLAGLEEGTLDALFTTGAIPTPALQDFAARRPDVRFVSIDPSVVEALSEAYFAYYARTVDARTYPGQDEPFRTLGLASTLMTNLQTDDGTIEALLALLVDEADALSERYFRAAFVSPETMRLGIAVPLHPAAERFYERQSAAASAQSPDPPEAPSATPESGSELEPPPESEAGP